MSASNDPQKINSTAWYYEYPRSIEVIVECRGPEGLHKVMQVRIAASKLERSLSRMEKPKSRKRKNL